MILTNILSSLRIELQDTALELYSDDDLIRAIEKSVSLMSRLLPKRSVVETVIGGAVTGETLTIASSTGTLTYKPVKPDSEVITSKTRGTHYNINYLTGVVTEIGSGLADGSYTVSYERDGRILDISSVLDDYIRLERLEYPVGNDPPTNPTFDLIGNYILVRGQKTTLTEATHLRIIYLARWISPTYEVEGDYPSHLNDGVIIGSAGQALIFKAEKYIQQAASALSALTAPPVYTFVKPTTFNMPNAPTAPTPPTPSYTAAENAMTAVGTEITAAKAHHTAGALVINAATRGADVAAIYGQYAGTIMAGAGHRASEAIARLRQIEEDLALYAGQVTAYGSAVNAYANNISGLSSKYRGDIDTEASGISNFVAQIQKYSTQITEQEMKARNFLDIAGRYLASGQSKIQEFLISLGVKIEFAQLRSLSEQRD